MTPNNMAPNADNADDLDCDADNRNYDDADDADDDGADDDEADDDVDDDAALLIDGCVAMQPARPQKFETRLPLCRRALKFCTIALNCGRI